MSTNKPLKYQDSSDQELVDLFGQLRDKDAVAELYERYRVSVGNFLYSEMKNKETVTDTFNNIMLQLVSNSSSQGCGRKVSIKLFAMAYAQRRKYISKEAQKSVVQGSPTNRQERIEPKNKLATLPSRDRDLIELVYKNNFTVDEVADIIGCTASVVRNCLSHIRNQYRPLHSVSTA